MSKLHDGSRLPCHARQAEEGAWSPGSELYATPYRYACAYRQCQRVLDQYQAGMLWSTWSWLSCCDTNACDKLWTRGHDRPLPAADRPTPRVVLCEDGVAQALTSDHKPDSPQEKERIYSAGGWSGTARWPGHSLVQDTALQVH